MCVTYNDSEICSLLFFLGTEKIFYFWKPWEVGTLSSFVAGVSTVHTAGYSLSVINSHSPTTYGGLRKTSHNGLYNNY